MRAEEQYPVEARKREISEILGFVTRGQSCQFISIPGAGRSTVLRLIAYNKTLREYHLKDKEQEFLFVYTNFAEIGTFSQIEIVKFMFLNLVFSLKDNEELYEKLHELFLQGLPTQDSLILFQYFKSAVEIITKQNITPIFLLDRFSEFAEKTDSQFFTNLKTLRIASGGKLSVVFSNHRPIETILTILHWKDFYQHFIYNQVFLVLKDEVATNFRIELLEKQYQKSLETEVKNSLYSISGGHAKIMRLTTEALISQGYTYPKEENELIDYLLKNTLVKDSLLEIWLSLSKDERKALRDNKTTPLLTKLQLPFPIFAEFVRKNMPESLIPKEIRLDAAANEIYYGDEAIEGLTPYEFRLLSYLLQNPHRVCERDEIIKVVWTDAKTQAGVTDEALDQMIYRLRKKVEDEPDNPRHIVTVKGRGFRFIP